MFELCMVVVQTRVESDHWQNRSTDRAAATVNQTSSKPRKLCAGNSWKFCDSLRGDLCAYTDPT